MPNKELIDYIKQNLSQGISKIETRKNLLKEGWKEEDIEEGFKGAAPSLAPSIISTAKPGFNFFKKFLNKKFLALFFVALISIVALVVFYYVQRSPDRVIRAMAAKMQDIKSFHLRASFEAKGGILPITNSLLPSVAPDSQQANSVNIRLDGDVDVSDYKNPLISLNYNPDSGGTADIFKAEARLIDKIIYFKLSGTPGVESIDLGLFKNRWIEIDLEAIKSQIGQLGVGSGIQEQVIENQLTDEQIGQLKNLAGQTKIFDFQETSGDEIVGGVKSYHYKFVLDKEGLKKFIIEAGKIINGDQLSEKDLIQLDESLGRVKQAEGEFWIGKKNRLLYKAKFDYKATKKDSEAFIEFTSVINLSDFNEPVNIEKPGDVMSIQEIITASLGEAQKRARDAKRITDVNILISALELYYNDNNFKYPVSLSDLEIQYVRTIPKDPVDDSDYLYAFSQDRQKYHIGTLPLESVEEGGGALANDDDFNSVELDFVNGFDGLGGYDIASKE